jgi:hypothetical protein
MELCWPCECVCRQAANGFSAEDAQMVIEGMAQAGVEPTFCMGDDIPLAVLSDKPHMLYNYFKQRFAQVCTTIVLTWHSSIGADVGGAVAAFQLVPSSTVVSSGWWVAVAGCSWPWAAGFKVLW